MSTFIDNNNINYTYSVPQSGNNGTAVVSYSPSVYGAFTISSSFVVNNVTYAVTTIGVNAFYRNTDRTGISPTIPNSVTSIGDNAFGVLNTSNPTMSGTIVIPNSVLSIGNYVFNNQRYIQGYTFEQNSVLQTIGTNAFANNWALTNINIPSSVTSIGNYAFSNTGLTNVIIPSLVTSISPYTFYNCNSLTSVTIPNSVTSIGNNAFQNCSSLTSITIPSSVTSIGNSAFNGCSNLTSVTFLGLIPTIGTNNFSITGDNVIYDQMLNAGNPNVATMLAMFTTNASIVPTYPICFPAGTPVLTDQGAVPIEKINPTKNTIRGKKIVAITKTTTLEDKIVCIEKDTLAPSVPSQKTFISRNHKLLYNKQMIKAKHLVGQVDGVYNKKYNGEILYNVLLETHEKMLVNNLIVETLDPKNVVAQLYNGTLSIEERNNAIVNINNCANEYKKQYGKLK